MKSSIGNAVLGNMNGEYNLEASDSKLELSNDVFKQITNSDVLFSTFRMVHLRLPDNSIISLNVSGAGTISINGKFLKDRECEIAVIPQKSVIENTSETTPIMPQFVRDHQESSMFAVNLPLQLEKNQEVDCTQAVKDVQQILIKGLMAIKERTSLLDYALTHEIYLAEATKILYRENKEITIENLYDICANRLGVIQQLGEPGDCLQ